VANVPGRADEIRRRASGFLTQISTPGAGTLNPILAGVGVEPASMAGADSPQRITSNVAQTEKKAIDEGLKAELKRWKKIALRELKEGNNPGEYEFTSEIIPTETSDIIKTILLQAVTPDQVSIAFSLLK